MRINKLLLVMIKEFRFVLPMTALQFNMGYRYVQAKHDKSLILWKENQPTRSCGVEGVIQQKTRRVDDLPSLAKVIAVSSKVTMESHMVNLFPRFTESLTTSVTGKNVSIIVDSIICDGDTGNTANIFNVPSTTPRKVLMYDAVQLLKERHNNVVLQYGGVELSDGWAKEENVTNSCCVYCLVHLDHTCSKNPVDTYLVKALYKVLQRQIEAQVTEVLLRYNEWDKLDVASIAFIEQKAFSEHNGNDAGIAETMT